VDAIAKDPRHVRHRSSSRHEITERHEEQVRKCGPDVGAVDACKGNEQVQCGASFGEQSAQHGSEASKQAASARTAISTQAVLAQLAAAGAK